MRFSVHKQDHPKQFFHSISAAHNETGLPNAIIKSTLERTNPRYHRKSDGEIFFIQKEPQIRIFTIEGEDFFSLEEIQEKFGLSQTKFINQVKKETFPKKIDWISPEILSPGNSSSSETKNEKSEVEFLREEMQKKMDLLSSRVLQLEKEKEELQVSQERNSPPEKSKKTSSAEMTIPFNVFKNWSQTIFDSPKAFAKFCRFGIIGQLGVNGPRRNKLVFLDGRIISVPDLLKELIVSHINPHMWKDGDDDAKVKFMEEICNRQMGDKKHMTQPGKTPQFIGKVRRCDEETIHDISVEFMKFV